MILFLSFMIVFMVIFILLYLVYHQSYNITFWCVIFTFIWIIPVILTWYITDRTDFKYSFGNFIELVPPIDGDAIVASMLLYISLASLMLLIGSGISSHFVKDSSNLEIYYNNANISKFWFLFFSIFWVLVVAIIMSLNGLPWHYVFFPAYSEKSIYVSYILRGLYLYIPLVFSFALIVTRDKFPILMVLFTSFISFSSGQRRDFLFFIIFVGAAYLLKRKGDISIKRIISFKMMIFLFVFSFSLVCILWMARVIGTNYFLYGEIVNPLEYRTLIDIFLGSGASGVPTAYFIFKNFDLHSFGYDIIYGITQLIPRSLYENKLIGIDSIIQEELSLSNSPSVFWFGDLIFSYGRYLLLIVAFFLGAILTYIQRRLMSFRGVIPIDLVSIILLSSTFTLFKNGLGTYISSVLTCLILVFPICILLIKNNKSP